MRITQPKGSGMCAVCVVAMATDTSVDQVYEFLNDGRIMGDPISDCEMAAYLLRHGFLMGGYWQVNQTDTPPNESVGIDAKTPLHAVLNGLPAFLGVQSKTYPGVEHAVYWDGNHVLDPAPSAPDQAKLSDYVITQIFPIVRFESAQLLRSLQMAPKPTPIFVLEYRETGPSVPHLVCKEVAS